MAWSRKKSGNSADNGVQRGIAQHLAWSQQQREKLERERAALPAPYLIDEREAARRLSLSVSSLARLRKKNAIPFRSIGRAIRYDPDALREWVKSEMPERTGNDGKGAHLD